MAIKDVEDRSYEQKNQQIANSKSMHKELERECKNLKLEIMRAQSKKQEYLEQRKNQDYDRKIALKDEKSQRQGGLMETEFKSKKDLLQSLKEIVKMLRQRYIKRKQKNAKTDAKLKHQIEEETAAFEDLSQRYNDLIKNFNNIVPEVQEEQV